LQAKHSDAYEKPSGYFIITADGRMMTVLSDDTREPSDTTRTASIHSALHSLFPGASAVNFCHDSGGLGGSKQMSKERLTAFSDGVIAIIITIMVLELKVPHESDWTALEKVLPNFLSYALSFTLVAIYWNNHHHLLFAAKRVNGTILWANTHLLFWLSLIPFATSWMGETHFVSFPVSVYGAVLLMPALAYYLLQSCIVRTNGDDKVLAEALGQDIKGKISPLLCIAGIGIAFITPWGALAVYVALALMWLVPDRRIEKSHQQ
jgi:uncharacterized membrane protein